MVYDQLREKQARAAPEKLDGSRIVVLASYGIVLLNC